MRKPVLAPSRFSTYSDALREEPVYSCYASSTVPSMMTSVSQSAVQAKFSLVNVICFSLLSVSVCINLALLYYIFYVKCS